MNDLQSLSQFFKAVGDENRLRILNLLHEKPHNAGELADLLAVKAPTVSHHLNLLREAGLVNLRAVGNQRQYSLNTSSLRRMKQKVQQMEKLDLSEAQPDDKGWIEALKLDEADRRVIKDYTMQQRLKDIPVKTRKLQSVLRWIVQAFEADVTYTEAEVNEILSRYHEDYARLRRELVDFKYLCREANGRSYWLPSDKELRG